MLYVRVSTYFKISIVTSFHGHILIILLQMWIKQCRCMGNFLRNVYAKAIPGNISLK